jgi:hypothetical protein
MEPEFYQACFIKLELKSHLFQIMILGDFWKVIENFIAMLIK